MDMWLSARGSQEPAGHLAVCSAFRHTVATSPPPRTRHTQGGRRRYAPWGGDRPREAGWHVDSTVCRRPWKDPAVVLSQSACLPELSPSPLKWAVISSPVAAHRWAAGLDLGITVALTQSPGPALVLTSVTHPAQAPHPCVTWRCVVTRQPD